MLPFEEGYFRERGFDVFPMGHPLMEEYGDTDRFERSVAARESTLQARDGGLTLALLPGSRPQELAHILPLLRVAARAVGSMLPDRRLEVVVSCAPGLDADRLAAGLDEDVTLCRDPLAELWPRTHLAIVCSGTASLEAALAGVPHEVVYRTGSFNYQVAKRLVRTERIGLSNLVLGEDLVREHIQDAAAPLPVATNLVRWVARPAERNSFYGGARRLRALCGTARVWERTAGAILELAERARA